MFGPGMASSGEKQGRDNIQNFLKVPFLLEGLISLGLLTCFDAFLHILTYLPVRCLHSVYILFVDINGMIMPKQVS